VELRADVLQRVHLLFHRQELQQVLRVGLVDVIVLFSFAHMCLQDVVVTHAHVNIMRCRVAVIPDGFCVHIYIYVSCGSPSGIMFELLVEEQRRTELTLSTLVQLGVFQGMI